MRQEVLRRCLAVFPAVRGAKLQKPPSHGVLLDMKLLISVHCEGTLSDFKALDFWQRNR